MLATFTNKIVFPLNEERSNSSPFIEFILKSNKVLINKPQGGFYLMPEFLNKKFNSSSEMCDNILKETGVALLPGSDFGFEKNKMLARLSFTDFDGQNFMNHTQKGEKIDDNLILKLAPKIVEGVDKLKKWSTST